MFTQVSQFYHALRLRALPPFIHLLPAPFVLFVLTTMIHMCVPFFSTLLSDMGGNTDQGSTQHHLFYALLRRTNHNEHFDVSPRFTSLTKLAFSGCAYITDDMLSVIGRMRWLEHLDLSDTRVTDNGIENMCVARQEQESEEEKSSVGAVCEGGDRAADKKTEEYGKQNSAITSHLNPPSQPEQQPQPHHHQQEEQPKSKRSLSTLVLRGTAVTDIGVRTLCACTPLIQSLNTLSLPTRVTDASVPLICSHMPVLSVIDVSFTSLSANKVRELIGALRTLRRVHCACMETVSLRDVEAMVATLSAQKEGNGADRGTENAVVVVEAQPVPALRPAT